jgi:hypothetical protein
LVTDLSVDNESLPTLEFNIIDIPLKLQLFHKFGQTKLGTKTD